MIGGPPIYHQTPPTRPLVVIDGMDARAAIWAHAFVPTCIPADDVCDAVFETVIQRRQLHAINGRPC